MCTSASVWIRRLLLGRCACMVKGYQKSRQKNTIHNDSNFPQNVCDMKMSYRITVTLASKAWQWHCWNCILPNRLVNLITILRFELLLTYKKKWEGRPNPLLLQEPPPPFSYVLNIGMVCLWYGFISVIERGPKPPPPPKSTKTLIYGNICFDMPHWQ